MAKDQIPGARLFEGSDAPENVALAGKDWRITTHDDLEHREQVIERKRLHLFRLRAIEREFDTLKLVAKNADSSGRMLGVACLYASALIHDVERRQQELAGIIKMHERQLNALEAQR